MLCFVKFVEVVVRRCRRGKQSRRDASRTRDDDAQKGVASFPFASSIYISNLRKTGSDKQIGACMSRESSSQLECDEHLHAQER